MAGRLRDDKKPRHAGRWIADPVAGFWRDADSAPGLQQRTIALYFHHYFAGENIEKLLGFLVIVPNLACARRKQLFDDAEVGILDQMPAVAIISPAVVLGYLAADCGRLDDVFWHFPPLEDSVSCVHE